MHDQYLDKLADDIMSLIEDEKPSEQNIGTRGTALINDFVRKPGVQESLAQLDVAKKVRLWGNKGSGMQILFHGADTPKKGSPHDHGQSWALYFQVTGVTEMTTYDRTVGEPGQPGEAILEKVDERDVTPGKTKRCHPVSLSASTYTSL